MRIGKHDQPFTSICTSDPDKIVVRGTDLCKDLIGSIDFTSYFWLLVTGNKANEDQRFLANAMLVALAEHGLVPSVVAARMTLAAAPEAMQGAVAAGILGCGSTVLGSAQVAGEFLSRIVAGAAADARIDHSSREQVKILRETKKRVPGFGHPQHAGGDPRANLLLDLAKDRGTAGKHTAALHATKTILADEFGKDLPININGAIPAILLDLSFPIKALKAIALLSRTAGLIGHLTEESSRPIGFILSGEAAKGISYVD